MPQHPLNSATVHSGKRATAETFPEERAVMMHTTKNNEETKQINFHGRSRAAPDMPAQSSKLTLFKRRQAKARTMMSPAKKTKTNTLMHTVGAQYSVIVDPYNNRRMRSRWLYFKLAFIFFFCEIPYSLCLIPCTFVPLASRFSSLGLF